ncbi:MAG: NIPSNAP family protein [Rhodomicrobiaceae bacterium]
MLFDVRTYTCRPGTVKLHLALYEKEGFPVQLRHLGKPLLYGVTESGPLNSYVHIWVFASAQDRTVRRDAMAQDPEWIAYLKRSREAGYLVAQENRLVVPAPFFSLDDLLSAK